MGVRTSPPHKKHTREREENKTRQAWRMIGRTSRNNQPKKTREGQDRQKTAPRRRDPAAQLPATLKQGKKTGAPGKDKPRPHTNHPHALRGGTL